jgi:hypothetical protein
MERRHKKLLIEKANELASGINMNHGEMLARLVSGGVISSEFVFRVSNKKKLYKFNSFQWNNVQFNSGIINANLELLEKVQNGEHQAFGIFYNALMHSFNFRAAQILRPLIDNVDAQQIDGEEFVRVNKCKITLTVSIVYLLYRTVAAFR